MDVRDFDKVAGHMGFGGVAHAIFRALGVRQSGTMSYIELPRLLQARQQRMPPAAHQMLIAMMPAWEQATEAEVARALDTSTWRIRGTTAEAVLSELRALLRSSGGHVADLIRIFDQV